MKFFKSELPDKWRSLSRKLAYAYEFFHKNNIYQKHVTK